MSSSLSELQPPPEELGAIETVDGWRMRLDADLPNVIATVLFVVLWLPACAGPATWADQAGASTWVWFGITVGSVFVALVLTTLLTVAWGRLFARTLEIGPAGVRVDGRLVPPHDLPEARFETHAHTTTGEGGTETTFYTYTLHIAHIAMKPSLEPPELEWICDAANAVRRPPEEAAVREQAERAVASLLDRASE